MPKARQNQPASSQKPPVDEKSRKAFLDELDGKIEVEEEPIEPKKRVKIQAEDDTVEAPADIDTKSLKAVLPDKPGAPGVDSTFVRAKKKNPWYIIVPILVVLAVVTAAGWYFFNRPNRFNSDNVGLTIEAPEQVASGDTVTLTVRYHNDETVDVRQSELSLTYPDGFTADTTSRPATNSFKNTFAIGTIASGQVGEIVITGRLIGAITASAEFRGSMTYRPTNFNSNFRVQTSRTVTISSSSVTVAMTGPQNIAPSASGTWTVTYTNTADEDLANLQLVLTYPESLSNISTTPKPTTSPATWRLPTLKAGASGTVKVTGTVSGAAGDSAQFGVALNLVQTGDVIEPQAQATFLTTLADTGLTVAVAANGSTDASAIKPGDPVTYSIKLTNHHDTEVDDATVSATVTGAMFDLAKRQDAANGALNGTTLSWTKANVPGLAAVKPNDEVSITFTVPTTAPTPAKADKDLNPQGSISVAVTAPGLPTSGAKPTVLVTKVQTILTFSANARYYTDDGVKLGSGPVPPKVGQTTAYRVTWTVASTTNDVTNFTTSTTLPSNVLWTGMNVGRDAGDISFDPTSRTVTWSINRVPGGTGSRYPVLTATFEVSITPTADQVGSVVVLTESTTATGTDSSANQKLTATAESLTSNVPNDPHASGEGAVVP